MLELVESGSLSSEVPFKHTNFILQRVFFAFKRLLVYNLNGIHLAILSALRQTHLREGSAEKRKEIYRDEDNIQ